MRRPKAVESINYSFVPNHRATMYALARAKLTSQETRLLISLMNQTNGYLREEDRISTNFWQAITFMSAASVIHTVGRLVKRGLIVAERRGSGIFYRVAAPNDWPLEVFAPQRITAKALKEAEKLLRQEEQPQHYIWLKNLLRLLSSQTTPDTNLVQPDKVLAPDTNLVQPDKVVVQPDTNLVQPDKVLAPDTNLVQPDKVVVQPDKVVVQPDKVVVQIDKVSAIKKPLESSKESSKERKKERKKESTPTLTLGEAKNVHLSIGEVEKLKAEFGESGTKERIEALSVYKASTGKEYKSDYYTILNWERRDKKGQGHGAGQSGTLDYHIEDV